MSFNTFGHLFRVTTFGESHGPAIGCVVDGCPPRIPLTEAEIQADLDRRRPGQSRFTTQRQEPDEVASSPACSPTRRRAAGDHRHADRAADRECRPALQGLFRRSRTSTVPATPTTPTTSNTASAIIAAAAAHRRARPRRAWRPARSRARSCRASWSAARWCRWARTPSTARAGTGTRSQQSVLLSRRQDRAELWADYLDGVRKAGSSVGAVIEVVAEGVPAGLGAPVYGKLDARSRRGADGHQRGQGRRDRRRLCARPLCPARRMPTRCGWAMTASRDFCRTMPAASSAAFPPASRSSCASRSSPPRRSCTPRQTVDRYGNETEIVTKGRHDPCVGIRAVPVGEAMVACVLADHYLRHRGQIGEGTPWPFPRA